MNRNYASPLLQKYLKAYEANPRSRVFAPLAEHYRKLGMLDKALQILNRGIKIHPTYELGYLGLASCYFDLAKYDLCYSTLRTLVSSHRENLRMQKLYADCCYQLDKLDESLEAYKYILYVNPRDIEAIERVQELEKINVMEAMPELPQFEEQDLNYLFSDDVDDWAQLDLKVDAEDEIDLKVFNEFDEEEKHVESWTKEEVLKVKVETPPTQDEIPEIKMPAPITVKSKPVVMTHSLVDLYFQQGHFDKAKDLLLKMLELNPNDKKTQDKLGELNSVFAQTTIEDESDVSLEEKGRHDLMSLFDQKVGHVPPVSVGATNNADRKKQKLQSFLTNLKTRSQEFKNRSHF